MVVKHHCDKVGEDMYVQYVLQLQIMRDKKKNEKITPQAAAFENGSKLSGQRSNML